MSEPRQHARSDFRTSINLLAGSIFLSIILCIPILNAPLVSDDWVLLDALVRNGIWGAWGGGGHEMLGFFRPLMTLTLWINMQLGGLNPLGYHLMNAVIHGIAAWLVGLVTLKLIDNSNGRSGTLNQAVFAAWLFFLAAPSHVEPVAWVSSRPDLMACALALGSFAVWISELKPALRMTLACVLYFLAMLAKESAIILPVIVLAYEWVVGSYVSDYSTFCLFLEGKRTRARIEPYLRTWPLFLILTIFLILRAASLGHVVGGYGSGRILSMSPLFWARNVGVDIYRSLLPATPSPGLDGAAQTVYAAIAVASMAAVALALALRIMKVGFKDYYGSLAIKFCLMAFLIAIVPVINLPLSIRSSEGERFIYLGSAFMAIALGAAVGIHIKRFWRLVVFGILLVYSFGFERSLGVWREAGAIAGGLVRQVQSETRMKGIEWIEVVNLPDHYRGAYVFRNGFAEALRLNGVGKEQVPEIKIKSLHPIVTAEDRNKTRITIKMPSPQGEVYRTRLPRE